MASSGVRIRLKLLIHKQEERVLYAEANSDFVDILFSFLTMPMGTIVRLLSKHSNTSQPPAIGSFNNLYQSIANLETKYFATEACKVMLLNTRNSAEAECQKLKINIDDIEPIVYFTCEDFSCTKRNSLPCVSNYSSVRCPCCSRFLNRKTYFTAATVENQQGVFVPPTASFVITDDLSVLPNIPASTLAILKISGFTDFGILEERTLNLGSTEILDLLKYSIMSRNPLTSMFLGKNYVIIDKSVQTITNNKTNTEGRISFKKMTVKVLVQKSNNKILLAEADEDFAELLFTFLSIPVGKVMSLLSSSHSSPLIAENLYKSVSNLNVNRYFKSHELKNKLLDPKMAEHYYSSKQIPPLGQATTPPLCCERNFLSYSIMYSGDLPAKSDYRVSSLVRLGTPLQFPVLVNPKGSDNFMKAPTMFMVTDDLVVTPLSSATCFNYLNSLKLAPSDVKEEVVNIGIQEALNLLWATLNTSSVLTNGLKDSVEISTSTENGAEKYQDTTIDAFFYNVYFVALATAIFVEAQKEKISIWPQS